MALRDPFLPFILEHGAGSPFHPDERGGQLPVLWFESAARVAVQGPIRKAERGNVMAVLFVEYPKCSTCKKAKAWLDAHGVDYVDRHIVEDNPTAAEIAEWQQISGLPVRRFFNTSGMLYRERNVKALLDAGMSDDDARALLAENGMMVKRPIVVGEGFVLVGFKEKEWESALL